MIFLFQHLGFVINLKKLVLDPAQEIEFLALIVNSQTMTLSLPEEKIRKIMDQCQIFYKALGVSVLDLTKLIETPYSTIQIYNFASYFLLLLSLKQTQSYTVLHHFRKADSHDKKRVVMVGQQFETLQWPINYKNTGTGPYSDRCIQKRVPVVPEGTGSTYQSSGTFSHKVCYLDICQNVENVSYTYPAGQHDTLELFAENGRD